MTSPHSFQRRPLTTLLWASLRISGLVTICATGFAAVVGYFWLNNLGVFSTSKEDVSAILGWKPPNLSIIYDKDSNKIGELFRHYQIYAPLAEVPQPLLDAVVAIEDQRFFSHEGFDAKGIARAFWMAVTGAGRLQGASTITQQVVRHFLLTNERTLSRKVREIALAVELEKHINKRDILELYVNVMFLGQNSYGVAAAAKRYFSKSLDQLAPEECALIAGLFQSPSRHNPMKDRKLARRRQLQVLNAMAKSRTIDRQTWDSWRRRRPVYKTYKPNYGHTAPYFVDHIKNELTSILPSKNIYNSGLRIHTTLDLKTQSLAEETLKHKADLLNSAAKNMGEVTDKAGKVLSPHAEAALLAVDPLTGDILAMVGGRDYHKSQFNRTIQARRSPGSAFKPIVYSKALDLGRKWNDIIHVAPVSYGTYRPKTPDREYMKQTTLQRAFYRSMNAPTVELGEKIGIQNIIEHARNLGVETPMKLEFGTVLGSSEVTMGDLARVYGVFATGGLRTDLRSITQIETAEGAIVYKAPQTEPVRVLGAETSFLMREGLRSVLMHGTAYKARDLAHWAAGKTGTSNQSKDNWFAGFSNNTVAIVWVGSDFHHPIRGNFQGSTLALPIWQSFMEKLLKFRTPSAIATPESLVAVTTDPQGGQSNPLGVKMWYRQGQEPKTQTKLNHPRKNNRRKRIFSH